MNIALIGGSGFVGTRLLDLLKDCPDIKLRNIDLLPSHFFNDISVIGDVREQDQMDEMLKGFDLVVLLAAQHRDDVTPTSLYYDTNVGGHEGDAEGDGEERHQEAGVFLVGSGVWTEQAEP